MREKGTEVSEGLSPRKVLKEKAQVSIRFKAASLGRFDKAEEGGAGMCSVGMAREEPVFPADHEGSNGIFGGVIIRRDMAVFHIPDQFGPMVEGIA